MVYNPGERVFGSTTPLYTVLLIFAKLIVNCPTPLLAVRLNAIFFLLCGLAIVLLIKTWLSDFSYACLGACAFLLNMDLLVISGGAMESYVFLALLLFSFVALTSEKSRPVLSGILVGLAILTRPEGILLIPAGLFVLRRSMTGALKFATTAFSLLAPWIIFATVYYGNPIPLSLIAKGKPVYPLSSGDALMMVSDKIAEWAQAGDPGRLHILFGRWGSLYTQNMLLMAILLVIGIVACIRNVAASKKCAWLPGGFLALQLAMYALGNPLVFDWYMPPIYTCIILVLLIGLPIVGVELDKYRPIKHRWLSSPIVCSSMTLIALLSVYVPLIRRYAATPYGMRAPIEILADDPSRLRVLAYRFIAQDMNWFCRPGTVIAAPEIGSFGYYSNARIIDACGLVSPDVHPFLPVPMNERVGASWGAISVEMVQALDPDYIVSMPVFCSRSLGRSEWFAEKYAVIMTMPLPKECWGSRVLLAYARRSAQR